MLQGVGCMQGSLRGVGLAPEGGALGYEAKFLESHVCIPIPQVCKAGQTGAKDGFECFSVIADEREVIVQILLNLLWHKAS